MEINIQGLQPIDDPSYRYTMPPIMVKPEGKGNGRKTVIENCVDVAEALHRDPEEITRYFGFELGSINSFNPDTLRSIVNGTHRADVLQNHLFRFLF